MKTVDVRLLVADDVDVELLVKQLISQTRGAGAPLGAVELVTLAGNSSIPSATVRTRGDRVWDGGEL